VRELAVSTCSSERRGLGAANTPVRETPTSSTSATFDVCMTSVFWTMRAGYPHLKQSGTAR